MEDGRYEVRAEILGLDPKKDVDVKPCATANSRSRPNAPHDLRAPGGPSSPTGRSSARSPFPPRADENDMTATTSKAFLTLRAAREALPDHQFSLTEGEAPHHEH